MRQPQHDMVKHGCDDIVSVGDSVACNGLNILCVITYYNENRQRASMKYELFRPCFLYLILNKTIKTTKLLATQTCFVMFLFTLKCLYFHKLVST